MEANAVAGTITIIKTPTPLPDITEEPGTFS